MCGQQLTQNDCCLAAISAFTIDLRTNLSDRCFPPTFGGRRDPYAAATLCTGEERGLCRAGGSSRRGRAAENGDPLLMVLQVAAVPDVRLGRKVNQLRTKGHL
jgi:hypothetical protein